MEADLSEVHGIDLRDRWRFEEVILASGRRVLTRKLTTRMIFVRIRHLPRDSALAIDANGGKYPWSLTDHLLADLWFVGRQQVAGKKARDHPGRPKQASKSTESPERRRKMRDAKRRAAAEQAARNRRAANGE